MENNGQRGATETRERHLIAVLRGVRDVNRLIASEDDPERLIERACKRLTAALGYHNAWIALLGREASRVPGLLPQGAVAATAAAGFNGGFAAMRNRLLRGEFPACMGRALEAGDTRVTWDPAVECPDCPLAGDYAGRAGLTRRLEFDGVTYGVLSVSLPVEYAKDAEEQELFDELAADLAFGLHKIATARRLAESQSRIASLGYMLDEAPAAITIHDTDGNFLFSNQQAFLLHGYDSVEEFLTVKLHDLDVPASAALVEERMRIIAERGEACFEVAHRRKDGSVFPLEVLFKQIVWAGRPALLSIATDITERKRAEERLLAANQQLRASEQQLRAYNQQLKATEQQLRAYNQQLAASEAALRLSEEKYRTLVEGSLQGVVIAQAGPVRLSFANTAMESLTGYSVDELTSMGPVELAGLIHPDDRERFFGNFKRRLAGEAVPPTTEYRLLRKDGATTWALCHSSAIDYFGEPATLTVFVDITDRKRAESQLKAEKEWSESLIEHAPNMVIGLQEGSKIAVFNRFAERLTGYRAEEVIGKEWIKTFMPEERRADIYRVWDDLIHGQMPNHLSEHEIITKSGDRRLIAWHNTTITENGEFRMILSLGEDVTELRRAQHEAAQRERLLSTITTNMIDMVSLADLEVRCTYASPSHRQLGYEPEDLVGRMISDAIHEEDRKRVLSAITKGMQTNKPGRALYRFRKADGSYAWLESIGKVLTDDRGEPTGLIFSTRDMTEYKNMQDQLAQSDRLSSMGMLAAGVAHEINNPLSYVMYNLESLTEDLPNLIRTVREFQAELESTDTGETLTRRAQLAQVASPAMLDDILARFKDALGGTQRIREVARGLGTFARVEKDQAVPVNLMHVIDVVLNMAFNEIKYRARLVKDYGRDLPTVLASESRLGQVFLNLIINASHAIDEGDRENNEIRVKTWSEGDSVFAQVKDTGAGIPPENMGKIFDAFFTTKKPGIGSGLGLAISKGIVEGYGGTIEVESEVGVGSCFTVRLPVARQEPTNDDKVQPVASETTMRGRILIVDDEDGIRGAMVRMLRGYDTVQAASGAEARQILKSDQAFDLILCDMMMPEVSGMDLHRWLIEVNPGLAKQLIFITGGAFTPHAREYLSQVDNLRLEKPFDVANFRKIVRDRITIVKGLKLP